MNWMKRSAMHAKGLTWLIAFGSANICGAQAQPATSKPFPESAASVLASHASASAPALAAAVSSPSSALSPMAAASQRGGELPVQLTNWPAHESTFAIDVVKAAIGAFLGAGLAFFSSYVQRRLQTRRENIAAGNLALFNIRAVSRSMSEMRLCNRGDVSGHRKLDPKMPIWALSRTWLYQPTGDLSFEYDSLTFLLDSEGGRKAVLHLRYVEEIYKHACHIYERNQEVAKRYKDKFAEKFDLHVTQQGIVNWAAFGEDVGQALVSEREGNFNALLYSTEIDIDEVQISFDLMKAELGKRFKGKAWNLDFFPTPTSNRHVAHMPSFPEDISAYVQERRDKLLQARAESGGAGS